MSSSSSDDDAEEVVLWDNPEEVSYTFIKTGKSKKEGVLITHVPQVSTAESTEN